MERYIKQIVDDVMEMAAKIQFLEAKLAAAESWNAEQLADAQATVEAAISDRDKQQDISKALYQQVEALQRELEHAKKMEAVQKEVADNQTWHVQKLEDWRDTVTLALQRPGGARFEDVPEHIKALVKEHATLRQLVEVHTKQLTELTIIPIGCSREQELRWTQSIKDLRATLAAQDAGEEVSSA